MKSARLMRTAAVLALALAGLAFTAAPAQAATTATCPTAVRVTPAIEIYDNNPHGSEDVGTLYLDYIGGTCRQALAEMNLKAKYIANGMRASLP